MVSRRDFLKRAALATAGSALAISNADAMTGLASVAAKKVNVNRKGKGGKMTLRFFPYELKLAHTFTVATYTRTTTPDVQVEIEYEGVTGYGEASMPPYLGQTVQSVTTFLQKVDLSQFKDPFMMDDILNYIDSLSPGDNAAKAAVDIALHDLVGKLMGQPWYRIWGLDPAKTPNTTFTIGIDTAEVVKQKTLECANKFKILKVKLGRENDHEMIKPYAALPTCHWP